MADINESIKERMKELNMNITDLARETGYTPQYMWELLNGRKRWNQDVMGKVFKVLGICIVFGKEADLNGSQ